MPSDCFLISSGSRIVHEKGFDLLINALAKIDVEIQSKVKLIIVGVGPELENLKRLTVDLKLERHVIFEDWLDIEAFKSVVVHSHLFAHPARRDAYGSTILGMAMGVPVVGSYEAGAAYDRIDSGRNGFLYHATDTGELASLITILVRYPLLRARMGEEALKTAIYWSPERGVNIIIDNII